MIKQLFIYSILINACICQESCVDYKSCIDGCFSGGNIRPSLAHIQGPPGKMGPIGEKGSQGKIGPKGERGDPGVCQCDQDRILENERSK